MALIIIFFSDETLTTTTKERYISENKSVMRISHLQQREISLKIQREIINNFKKIMKKIDGVIFSDFNYGCLPNNLIKQIIEICKKNKIWVSADCQSSSQIGDISKYKNVNLMTPTEQEARISTRNQHSGLIVLCESLRKDTFVKNIILKLGAEGILIHSKNKKKKNKYLNDRIPSLNDNAKSTVGAGDCMLVASTLSFLSGGNVWESAYLGSLAAALQVDRMGNVPLKSKTLKTELKENFKK